MRSFLRSISISRPPAPQHQQEERAGGRAPARQRAPAGRPQCTCTASRASWCTRTSPAPRPPARCRHRQTHVTTHRQTHVTTQRTTQHAAHTTHHTPHADSRKHTADARCKMQDAQAVGRSWVLASALGWFRARCFHAQSQVLTMSWKAVVAWPGAHLSTSSQTRVTVVDLETAATRVRYATATHTHTHTHLRGKTAFVKVLTAPGRSSTWCRAHTSSGS